MQIAIKKLMLFAGLCMVSTLASAADTYQVSGVTSGDTLNMRSQPGSKSAVTAKIPADTQGITATGKHQSVGKTVWQEIVWNGKQGWVNQAYLAPTAIAVSKVDASKQEPATKSTASKPPEPPQPQSPAIGGVKQVPSGTWILECGNASPYWKVEVLPEWLNLHTPASDSGVPIQYRHQEKSKWSKAAAKTELRGKLGTSSAEMTLAYIGNCSSSLARKKVPFSVSGVVNGENVSGCCRSIQVP